MDTHFDTTLGGHVPGIDLSRVPLITTYSTRAGWIAGRAANMRAMGCSEAHVAEYTARDNARPGSMEPLPATAGTVPAALYVPEDEPEQLPSLDDLPVGSHHLGGGDPNGEWRLPQPLPDAYPPAAW